MTLRKTRAIAACIGALAITAIAAAPASAVPASFSGSGAMTASFNTTLVFKAKPAGGAVRTFTCTPAQMVALNAGIGTQVPSGSTLSMLFEGWCTGPNPTGPGYVNINSLGDPTLLAQKIGSVFSLKGTDSAMGYLNGGGAGWYGTGWYRAVPDYTVAWTNGTSIANPSKATFNDIQIGVTTDGTPITLTGTISFTRGGNLVTLN